MALQKLFQYRVALFLVIGEILIIILGIHTSKQDVISDLATAILIGFFAAGFVLFGIDTGKAHAIAELKERIDSQL